METMKAGGLAAYGVVIRCHVNPTAVFFDCISMKIFERMPMMLAVSGFDSDVFSGLAGVRSAYTAILMSTSS